MTDRAARRLVLRSGVRFSLSPALVLLVCVLIWLDDGSFSLPFLLSCALHELGHLTAMRLCGVRLLECQIGLGGAVIRAEFPTAAAEYLVTLCGPLVNLMLLALSRAFPANCADPLFFVNLVLLLYNLLPLYPLDGGRLLRLTLQGLCSAQVAERIELVVACLSIFSLLCICLYALMFLHTGLFPLIPAAGLLFRLFPLVKSSVQW